jgi:hypothetical protein
MPEIMSALIICTKGIIRAATAGQSRFARVIRHLSPLLT